jgi:hypothetical protein
VTVDPDNLGLSLDTFKQLVVRQQLGVAVYNSDAVFFLFKDRR